MIVIRAIAIITTIPVKKATTVLDTTMTIGIIIYTSITIAIRATTVVKNYNCYKHHHFHTLAKVIMTKSFMRIIKTIIV